MHGFGVDTTELVQMEAELDRLNKYGIPNAIRNSLTTAAEETVEHARGNLGKRFTLRNNYTARSIVSDRATGRHIEDMRSFAGSLQKYMEKQEDGYVKRATGKHGLAIPSPAAAGETGKVSKRFRSVLRRNYLDRLKPISAHSFHGPIGKDFNIGKGGVAMAARAAIQEKSRVIFIDRRRDHWHRKTGFYRVLGGHLNNPHQRGLWPSGARLQLLYSVNKRQTVTKSHEWLMPAAEMKAKNIDAYYIEALDAEIRKGKFRGR